MLFRSCAYCHCVHKTEKNKVDILVKESLELLRGITIPDGDTLCNSVLQIIPQGFWVPGNWFGTHPTYITEESLAQDIVRIAMFYQKGKIPCLAEGMQYIDPKESMLHLLARRYGYPINFKENS